MADNCKLRESIQINALMDLMSNDWLIRVSFFNFYRTPSAGAWLIFNIYFVWTQFYLDHGGAELNWMTGGGCFPNCSLGITYLLYHEHFYGGRPTITASSTSHQPPLRVVRLMTTYVLFPMNYKYHCLWATHHLVNEFRLNHFAANLSCGINTTKILWWHYTTH